VRVKALLTIIFIGYYTSLLAQNFSNAKVKFLTTKTDTVVVDTLSIVATTFKIKDTTLIVDYELIQAKGLLVWKSRQNLPDSVEVQFECFPFLFEMM